MPFRSLGVDLEKSAGIGDLFADLYDALEPRWAQLYERCDSSPLLLAPSAFAAEIRSADGDVPASVRAFAPSDSLLGAYAVLRAIDAAFARFDASTWPRTYAELARTHTLTRASAPVLLPGGGVEDTGEFATNFQLRRRIPRAGLNVTWAPVPRWHDVLPPAHPRLRVAFLPAIDSADVEFVRITKPNGAVFEAVHTEGAEDRVFKRFVRAVETADAADAAILLAPELSFTPALWDRARAWLRGLPKRVGGGVRWLLLGTAATDRDAAGRPRNQARLVSRHGSPIAEQNKTRPFSFTPRQLDFYNLKENLGVVATPEHIRLDPRVLVLVESATLGRVSILICEDLAHEEPGPAVAAPLGVRLYLTPVMDGEFADWRWVTACATSHAWSSHVQVIAVNSLVLPERTGRPASSEGRAIGVAGPLSAWRPGDDGSPAPWPPRIVHLAAGEDVVVAEVEVHQRVI